MSRIMVKMIGVSSHSKYVLVNISTVNYDLAPLGDLFYLFFRTLGSPTILHY